MPHFRLFVCLRASSLLNNPTSSTHKLNTIYQFASLSHCVAFRSHTQRDLICKGWPPANFDINIQTVANGTSVAQIIPQIFLARNDNHLQCSNVLASVPQPFPNLCCFCSKPMHKMPLDKQMREGCYTVHRSPELFREPVYAFIDKLIKRV